MPTKIVKYVGLGVELPMVLEVDNRGTKDMDQNFASSVRTKYMEVVMLWLGELPEKGILGIRWIKWVDNETEIQRKNVSGLDFNRHCKIYCYEDIYS